MQGRVKNRTQCHGLAGKTLACDAQSTTLTAGRDELLDVLDVLLLLLVLLHLHNLQDRYKKGGKQAWALAGGSSTPSSQQVEEGPSAQPVL